MWRHKWRSRMFVSNANTYHDPRDTKLRAVLEFSRVLFHFLFRILRSVKMVVLSGIYHSSGFYIYMRGSRFISKKLRRDPRARDIFAWRVGGGRKIFSLILLCKIISLYLRMIKAYSSRLCENSAWKKDYTFYWFCLFLLNNLLHPPTPAHQHHHHHHHHKMKRKRIKNGKIM